MKIDYVEFNEAIRLRNMERIASHTTCSVQFHQTLKDWVRVNDKGIITLVPPGNIKSVRLLDEAKPSRSAVNRSKAKTSTAGTSEKPAFP